MGYDENFSINNQYTIIQLPKCPNRKGAKLTAKLKGERYPNSKEMHIHEYQRRRLTQCRDHSRRLVNMK